MNFKIKKILQRINQILKEFVYDLFHYSPYYAIDNLCWWLFYYCYPWGRIYFFFEKRKHSFILSYLEKHCPQSWHFIQEYHSPVKQKQIETFRIWVFWWQGMENAPELVKVCYQQLCKNCGEKVILLTKDNLSDYISLPNYIYEKVNAKKISFTHFSDIIRVSLLAEYGGLWIDATCWTSFAPPSWIFQQPFYSCKINDSSLWRGWLMGTCIKDYPVFALIRMIYLEYWEKNDHIIDYLLLDHLLMYLFDTLPQVRQDMLNLPVNNSHRSELYNYLPRPWNPQVYEKICGDTWCFKLSWKTKFSKQMPDGEKTFYGWLEKTSRGLNDV